MKPHRVALIAWIMRLSQPWLSSEYYSGQFVRRRLPVYKEINGVNVLCGIFSEQESQAVYFLSQESVTRVGVMTYLSDIENKKTSFNEVYDESFYARSC